MQQYFWFVTRVIWPVFKTKLAEYYKIMQIIQEEAGVVDGKDQKKPAFVWTLPYFQYQIKKFYFKTERLRSRLDKEKRYLHKDAQRNRRSSSPNFVHSYDALHMLINLNYIYKKNELGSVAPNT